MQEVPQLSKRELLARELELAFDPYNDRRQRIVSDLPRELEFMQDGERKTIQRELLLTEAIESGLIQTSVAATVAEGANPAKCWFNILPQFRIKGNVYTWNYGEAGMYAGQVAEGAELPDRTQDYTSVSFAVKKYGQKPRISNEMVEDGMADMIAQEISFAGLAVQNKVEQVVNDEMLESSSDEHDTATTAGSMGVKAVIGARVVVEGHGFQPDAVVMTPGMQGQVLLDMVAPQPIQFGNGAIPNGYLGMKWGMCNVSDVSGGSYVWGYGTNSYIMGMVLDSKRAGAIGIARPLSVERFNDAIHDLQGMSVTMRMDAQAFSGYATARVEY